MKTSFKYRKTLDELIGLRNTKYKFIFKYTWLFYFHYFILLKTIAFVSMRRVKRKVMAFSTILYPLITLNT
ncbi:MAG: hypothetical protein DRN04_09820 [Thermoprotei archaeon]|nr:MAG: hypothetical protein DRN04_09820 [Thermoprotei archaeon]